MEKVFRTDCSALKRTKCKEILYSKIYIQPHKLQDLCNIFYTSKKLDKPVQVKIAIFDDENVALEFKEVFQNE